MISKAILIQRRWKEVVKDLSEQHGIDSKPLLQKMSAFSSGGREGANSHQNNGRLPLQTCSVSEVERKVLREAADTMAEVIFAMVSD